MSMNAAHKIIIITAPSGAGKTSITRHLLKKYPQLEFSVSAATRSPRRHEKDGVDYYFLSLEDFKQKIVNEEFRKCGRKPKNSQFCGVNERKGSMQKAGRSIRKDGRFYRQENREF